MSLAERIAQTPARPQSGLPCSVGHLLDTLPADEAAALQRMLTDGWTQKQIVEALRAEGHMVAEQTPNRHRARSCRCFKADQ